MQLGVGSYISILWDGTYEANCKCRLPQENEERRIIVQVDSVLKKKYNNAKNCHDAGFGDNGE